MCLNRDPPAAHNPYEDWPDGEEPGATAPQEVVVESHIVEAAPSAPPPMEVEPFNPPEEEGDIEVPSAMPSKSEIGEVF